MQGPHRLVSSLRLSVFPALIVLAVGALGCGRTELFGARKCAPTDPKCQMQIVDGGIDGKPDGRIDGNKPDGNPDGKPDMKIDGGPDMKVDGPLTCQQMREICGNGKDDNCNGLSDCNDPGCLGDRACVKPGVEVCNNTLDDDDDQLVDCADPDCKNNIACRPTMGMEICDNGVDDNGDKLVDCSDAQCTMFPACLEIACTSDFDFGPVAPHGYSKTWLADTRGASRSFSTCATPGGVARVGRFVLTGTTDVRVGVSQTPGAAHAVSLFRAGANQACDRNPVGACLAVGGAPSGTRTFAALAAGTYWVVVQSYPNTQGELKIDLSTGNTQSPEQCANGVDDDMNGLIDCQDTACRMAPNCAPVSCMPDGSLGALVVGAPPKNARIDLTQGKDQFSPYCAGTTPGKAVALSLTMPEAGGIEVAFNQTGATVIALFKEPAPGVACDHVNNDHGCQQEDIRGGALAFQGVAAGRYILILKAIGSKEGVINLRVSAFANRDVEICGNGIDDDGDKLKDCDDPECFGVGSCGAPACTPDQNLGALGVGSMVSAMVDTRGAPDFYQAGCGRGDGPERVLRLTVNEYMQLGVDCMGSGSHVLTLARQLGPLDQCDADMQRQCADPDLLPFGCGYSIPGVQPGTYNFIVEAFQKGSEGVLNLSLTGIRQTTANEVCDNGVDDDKDGFVDCMDRKCVTDTACAKYACRADQQLDILPLDGSVLSAVIGTSQAGDDQKKTACVSAPGGQDGVVDFEVPARANVTLEWAQVGTHAFALYSDLGNVFSCDAGTQIACVSSVGQTAGTAKFANLPAGPYHLVIDADRPGTEGGVVIRLSGTAAP
jgi:uncharacterized protein (DUF2141 family)